MPGGGSRLLTRARPLFFRAAAEGALNGRAERVPASKLDRSQR